MMSRIFLDIETIPSEEDWVSTECSEAVKPPKNIKKQESIDKWYEEKHADAVLEAKAKCSFDGAMNHIICICAAHNNDEVQKFYIKDTKEEAAMLRAFFDWCSVINYPTFVGHNIAEFDMKIIRQRAMVLGVSPATNMPFKGKPWDDNPFDTMKQWDARNPIKMDKLAKAFGVQGKSGIDGSMVWPMWKDCKYEEIADYCADDVRITREIYKKMKYDPSLSNPAA